MGIDLRLPNINGATEREQLLQIKNFLYQHIEQLQFALNSIGTSNNTSTGAVTAIPSSLVSPAQTTVSADATFGSIKALIIKSADIVNAYYEEINKRLVGEYVAQSDFGTFEEQTSQDVFENSTNINRSFGSIQEIKSGVDSSIEALTGEIGEVDTKVADVEASMTTKIQDLKTEVEALNFSIAEVAANIKSGLLYYDDDGVPVYGLEVGQRNVVDGVEVFNKYARFTAGRLSFYDQNGTEVAYISDYKLYITHAEVTGALKLGGFAVDTTNGLTFKWVGRR